MEFDSPVLHRPGPGIAGDSARQPIFVARDLYKIYPSGEMEVRALDGLDLELYEGELIVLLGASGSGKSTLLNNLGGLDVPTSGELIYRGNDLARANEQELTRFRRDSVGFVFQFYNLIPSLTARENVALITEISRDPMTAEEALDLVGLSDRMDHFPSQLSGGQQQRVAIARAIAKRPEVLLCDEPTGALDVKTGITVLEAVERVNRELGTLTAIITHNAVLSEMADRILHMSDGKIVQIDPERRAQAGRRARLVEMRALDRKLLRDLGKMKGQMLAVGLVMACGLAMMIMSRSLLFSLETTRDAYYERNRFADVFGDLKRAPNDVRKRLQEIPGVAAVETRVTGKVTLDLPGLEEPADGVTVSIPDDRPQQLNQIFLRSGRLPRSGSRGEVTISEAFAEAHAFQPGNTIPAIIRGQRQILTIVGIALSPEYVFEARPGDTLPDNRRFGIFWMNERELSVALELDGAFNNVLVDLAPGTTAAPVIAELDRILTPYGALGAITRRDHPSAMRLDDEIRVLRALAIAFPAAFLSIAAFMSSAVLTRLIRLQREQIAQLKAFGYSSREVGWHYIKFALAIVIVGTIIGTIGGFWLGSNVVSIYHLFFRFPSLPFRPDTSAIAMALLASAGASFVGVLGAVRQAVRLPPAEAMRPEPPAEFKPSIFERIGLHRFVSTSFRMALRNLERRPWQAIFTGLGLALATGIPIVPGAMRDGINHLLGFQWDSAQRQDVTVSLQEPGSATALSDLRHLPGVLLAEPFRSVPARLRFGHRTRRLGVTGLVRGATLNRLLDGELNRVPLPPDGLLVSAKLAELLGAKPGDTIILEVLEGDRPNREAVIHGLITDYSGIAAYMEIDSLRRLMQEGGTVSGAHLSIDHYQWSAFLREVKETPRIASLMIKDAVRASFEKTTAQTISLLQGLYFTFSVVVAFGVVYNSARIALSERSRDLATLRVIGFTNAEVAGVLIGELLMLTVLAIPVGLLLGSGIAASIISSVNTETVRLPLVLSAQTYSTAIIIVLVSASISFAIVGRRVRQLDLLSVLKARE